MTDTTGIFLLLFALVTMITWMALFTHGRLWRKVVALLALVALAPLLYISINELLGLPKPAETAWLDDLSNYQRVIGYDIHEDKAIYLWLDMSDGAEPRVFSFPYEKDTVVRLQDAQDRANSLAAHLLARVVRDEDRPEGELEFTNQSEFVQVLPVKPQENDDGVLVFDSRVDNGQP